MAKVVGSRRRRPKLRWLDGVNAGVLERKVLNIEDAIICVHDRDICRRVVDSKHMWAD
jgi:hypothetical protein